jgi:Fic family protein
MIMGHMISFDPGKPYNNLPLLPPDRALLEMVEILKQEARALSALGELKGIANIIPNQSILINAIVLQEAQDSSEIENIITTRDSLYQAVARGNSPVDPSVREVIHYREAVFQGFARIRERGLLSVNDMIAIQEILVGNNAGVRNQPGTALVNDRTGAVIYAPPSDADRLNALLGNFVSSLHDEASLAKLAALHYQFESIHPFFNGNGRTGRIINVLYLVLKGYLDTPLLYLSSYINRNRDLYYSLLLGVTKDQNWLDWILFFLKGIEVTARESVRKIHMVKVELDRTAAFIRERAPKIYSRELAEALFVNPYCKVEFIVRSLGVERKAASRYLHQLADIGILDVRKLGKENIFIHHGLMDILKNNLTVE